MSRNPSGSSLARALACPASHALPQVESTSPAAERGTAIHAVLERLVTGGDLTAAEQEISGRLDLDSILPHADAAAVAEIGYSWHPLEREASMLYRMDRPWIPLRIDLVVIHSDGAVEVCDYKTGWSKLPEPDAMAQLMLGALCVATYHSLDSVRVTLVHAPLDAIGRRTSRVVDVFDLLAFADEIADVHERIDAARAQIAAGQPPDVREGPHCQYCPAQLHCPAKQQALATITGPDATRYLALRLDEENASEALRRARIATELTRALWAGLHAYAAHTPIPVGDGKVWGLREKRGTERVVPEKIPDVLRVLADELGSEEYAHAALDMQPSASKKSIREAIRAALAATDDGRTLAHVERDVMRRLRDVGAVAAKPTTAYEEYDVSV